MLSVCIAGYLHPSLSHPGVKFLSRHFPKLGNFPTDLNYIYIIVSGQGPVSYNTFPLFYSFDEVLK